MARPFLDGAQSRRILALASPVVLAMLTQTGVNIVDTYFLGKLPAEDASDAQAALMPALMLVWAIGGFLSAISVGTQAMTARRFGEGDRLAAGTVLPNALVITFIGGTVATVLGWWIAPYVFGAIADNHHVAHLGTVYTRMRYLGIMSMAGTAAYKSFFDGIGRTHLHFFAAIVMNIVNALLCWLLIFGNLGMPRMGIAGAGIAGASASWIGLLVMVGFSLQRQYNGTYRFYRRAHVPPDTKAYRSTDDLVPAATHEAPKPTGIFHRRMMWDLVKLSVPGGLATTVAMTGFAVFFKIVAALDRNDTHAFMIHGVRVATNEAATTIIIQVLSATFSACIAFGTATATLVGQSLGERKPDLAERYAWTSVKLGILIFGTIGAILFFLAPQVMHVFSKDLPVIAAGTSPLRLVCAMGPLVAVSMILTQALFGAGETRYVMIVEASLHFGLLVPGAWLLGVAFHLGLMGIWASAVLYALMLATLMAVRFAAGGWKKIKV